MKTVKRNIIAMALALAVMFGCAINVSAICLEEDNRPTGIINRDLYEKLNDKYSNTDCELKSHVKLEMEIAETNDGEWLIVITSEDTDRGIGYGSIAAFDHRPTADEIMETYCNRVVSDEFDELIDELEK